MGGAAATKRPGRLSCRFYSNALVAVAAAGRKEHYSELFNCTIVNHKSKKYIVETFSAGHTVPPLIAEVKHSKCMPLCHCFVSAF